MRKKDLLSKISELENKLRHLEETISIQDQMIENFQSRENEVTELSVKLANDMDSMLENARQQSSNMLKEAEGRSYYLVKEAESKAEGIVSKARYQSDEMIRSAESVVSDYKEVLQQYNEVLEQSAFSAYQNAQKFASFAKQQIGSFEDFELKDKISLADSTSGKVSPCLEPNDSPASVMRNIYRIQNRNIPDDVLSEVEKDNIISEENNVQFTVSDLISESDPEQDTNLDELLDEIIKAGENKNNG